jgi:peptidyl-prolyl cis-trans isomerase D
MLAFLRRKQKGLKWILWVVIIILGAGMIALFVPGRVGDDRMNDQEAAKVGDRTISRLEYRKQYNRLYNRYREMYHLDQQDPELIKRLGIGQQALNGLISEYAIVDQARKLGLDASPEEVRQEIAKIPVFAEQGQFIGPERYKQILEANDMTVAEFEEGVRREIIREKLLRLLTDGIIVSPEEALQEFLSRNQEVKVRYVAIDKQAVTPAEIDDAKLRDYYNRNKENYRLGELRRVAYVFVPINPMAVKVTEDQIQDRLAALTPEARVRVRQILIRAPEGQPAPEAEKKAQDILARVQAGEDFAKLAKEYSDDLASAGKGGELGALTRGQMPREFDEAAFSMEPGQTRMVRSALGFHIINLEEKTTADIQSQRGLAELQAKEIEAGRQAKNQAFKIINAVRSGRPLAEVAKEYKLNLVTTPFFSVGDPVPGMMVQNDFNQRVFSMKKGDVTPPYQGSGGYYVAELAGIQTPEVPPFDQVRQRVAEDYRNAKTEEMAREKAFAFEKAAKSGDFEQAAKKAGLNVVTTGFFKKGANVDDTLRISQDFHDRAFKMAKGEVSPPISIAGKYVVFQLVDKSEVDMSKFQAEKAAIEREVTERKKAEFFSEYMRNLIDEMRKKNEIVINQTLDVDAG